MNTGKRERMEDAAGMDLARSPDKPNELAVGTYRVERYVKENRH